MKVGEGYTWCLFVGFLIRLPIINEGEQQYLQMKSKPQNDKYQWECGSKSEINGQKRLCAGKRL